MKALAIVSFIGCLFNIWRPIGGASAYEGDEWIESYTIYRWAVDHRVPQETFEISSVGVQICVFYTTITFVLFAIVMRICLRWEKQSKILTPPQWKIVGWIGGPVLLIAWATSYFWGIKDVRKDYVVARSSGMGFVHGDGDRQFKILTYNPEWTDGPDVEAPYSYVTNESLVMPFIVSLDWGYRAGMLDGVGYRVYVFWCFGYKIPIYSRLQWLS